MVKKFFVVTDIHSYYFALMKALQEAGFDATNPNHIFVSLGDLFDRGTHSVECLDFVMSLDPARRILVRGNHEDLLENCIRRNNWDSIDYDNGTVKTLLHFGAAYSPSKLKDNAKLQEYLHSLRNFYETKHGIFVHGWIPCTEAIIERQRFYYFDKNWRAANEKEWGGARWLNGMAMWDKGIFEKGKQIFCGHWHTSWGHHYIDKTSLEFPDSDDANSSGQTADFSPFVKEGIVALDACTALTHKINCYVFEDEVIDM